MTKITKEARERLKNNIRFVKKQGHTKMALDLAFHVYFADTLHYHKEIEGLDKPKKQIQ
jgi:hypothetical protein